MATAKPKTAPTIKPPFPYFGGKAKVAHIVWSRFGDVRNYVEPFAGSLAVLLNRPHYPFDQADAIRTETVNDLDCVLANFWRAMQADPEQVANYCDWPINEADLRARHSWLVNVASEHVERLKTDPEYYDAKIAGWWCWGICQWIGGGWCSKPGWKRPHLGTAGLGVHRPSQRRPHLGKTGSGVHRPKQQRPHLGNAGNGDAGSIVNCTLVEYLTSIADRIRRVRVCCGYWSRVLGKSPTFNHGMTGVFLDPPYADTANRCSEIYAQDSLSVAHDVREWAIENGNNPLLRICLAGYEGEHEMPENWECVAWKAHGGMANTGKAAGLNGRDNAKKERLWFSPYCLKDDCSDAVDNGNTVNTGSTHQLSLFDE